MANVKNRIMAHNKKILNELETNPEEKRLCNCRIKNNCPVNGQCLLNNVVYKATVVTKSETKSYIGSAGNSFKERFTGHKQSFKSEAKRNTTALAKYIWEMKDSGTDYNLQWEILRKTRRKYDSRNGCELCVLEKIEIANAAKGSSLNRRNELQSKCPHYKRLFF
jgi:hypothetical protein